MKVKEDQIRRLIEIFQDSGVEELEYHESAWHGTRIRLTRSRPVEGTPPVTPAPAPAGPATAADPPPTTAPADEVDDGLHAVTSPMVGTFYRSPSPEAEAFVQPGDRVRAGQTICIIEAMKIMNEIEADVDGEVVDVGVDNGSPVEYGQILFRLRPS